jgi:hypothetical protein
MLTYLLLWFPMMLIAVLNGTARDLVYKKYTGELTAHQLSTISLLILLGLYIWRVMHNYPASSATEALLIGTSWMTLTLVFEFGLGRARGRSWSELMADYQVQKGRIWVLIPIGLLIAPWLFFQLAQQ